MTYVGYFLLVSPILVLGLIAVLIESGILDRLVRYVRAMGQWSLAVVAWVVVVGINVMG